MDLTAAEIPDGETLLDLTAIMGGIDVKIPPDLAVVYEGTAILGGSPSKIRKTVALWPAARSASPERRRTASICGFRRAPSWEVLISKRNRS